MDTTPDYTPADEKLLALSQAFTALALTLVDAGVIERNHLFSNLAGARNRLEEIGETGAAAMLGELNESLLSI